MEAVGGVAAPHRLALGTVAVYCKRLATATAILERVHVRICRCARGELLDREEEFSVGRRAPSQREGTWRDVHAGAKTPMNIVEVLVVVVLLFLSVFGGRALFKYIGWRGLIPAALIGLVFVAFIVISLKKALERRQTE